MNLSTDCLIIGGGPAGLTAATYLGRFRRNVLVIDSGDSRAMWIPISHNILGFSEGVSGPDLLDTLRRQAAQYGARMLPGRISRLKRESDGSFLAIWESGQVSIPNVLLATGGLDVEPEIRDVKRLVKDGLIRHCLSVMPMKRPGKR